MTTLRRLISFIGIFVISSMAVSPTSSSEGNEGSWQWVEIASGDQLPVIGSPCVTYHPVSQNVILFGDHRYNDPGLMWEWDGSRWTSAVVDGVPECLGRAAVFDPIRGRVVVLHPGRDDDAPMIFSTWDGNNWHSEVIEELSRNAGHILLGVDPTSGDVLLRGGMSPAAGHEEDPCFVADTASYDFFDEPPEPFGWWRDTWRLEEDQWAQVDSSCADAPPLFAATFFFAEPHGDFILLGSKDWHPFAENTQIFRWTGDDWALEPQAQHGAQVTAGAGNVAAFDDRFSALVVVGHFRDNNGSTLLGTWAWSRTNGWREIPVPETPVLVKAAFYDQTRSETMLLKSTPPPRGLSTYALRKTTPPERGCCTQARGNAPASMVWLIGCLMLVIFRRKRVLAPLK